MTIASIDSPSRTASTPKSDALALKNDQDTRSEASGFGQVMSGVMPPPGDTGPKGSGRAGGLAAESPLTDGQGLAESPLGSPLGLPGLNAAWGGDFLKAVHLGPRLNVITAESAAPDAQSLEAFARSQGLDETAVQWLMGTAPGLAAAPPNFPTPGAVSQASAGVLDVSASPSAELSTVTAGELMTTDATSPDTAVGRNALNSTALNTAALWAMAQPTEKARMAPPAAETTTEAAAALSVQVLSSPAPTAIWMLRHAQATAPGKEAAPNKTGIAESELDLSEAAPAELLESLGLELAEMGAEGGAAATSDTHPAPLSGHAGHRMDTATAARLAAQNPDASAPTSESGTTQRSENIQNLAEKMGQAVGQRILSEIEKGQWHLKLSLRPATLGHIEVEMRMRSGELDAVFTTTQALTRELLQDSMPKLKDTLNQMGMDVASLQVGDGQTQQRGGESTPGQMSKSTKTGKNNPTPTAPQAVSVPRMKMGQDGWDVLV